MAELHVVSLKMVVASVHTHLLSMKIVSNCTVKITQAFDMGLPLLYRY